MERQYRCPHCGQMVRKVGGAEGSIEVQFYVRVLCPDCQVTTRIAVEDLHRPEQPPSVVGVCRECGRMLMPRVRRGDQSDGFQGLYKYQKAIREKLRKELLVECDVLECESHNLLCPGDEWSGPSYHFEHIIEATRRSGRHMCIGLIAEPETTRR